MNRRHGLRWLGAPLLLACTLLAPSRAQAQAAGPAEVAMKFFEASQAWRCDEVWRYYSRGTQENYLAETHRYERERNGEPRPDPPEKHFCAWTSHKLKRGSARILRLQGNEAVVAVDFSGRVSRRRYDLFPPTVTITEQLHLVREAGAWRVEQPRLPVGRKGWRLTEVGRVDVFQEEGVYPGLLRKLEATMVSRMPRARLDAILRDAKSWALALPSVSAAETLERTAESERLRLVFAAVPERSATLAVALYGKPLDPARLETERQWTAEGGNKAPVYFRGSWKLEPHHDGTRITMTLLIDPRHWPDDVAEGVFSAQRMAQAMLALEKSTPGPAP